MGKLDLRLQILNLQGKTTRAISFCRRSNFWPTGQLDLQVKTIITKVDLNLQGRKIGTTVLRPQLRLLQGSPCQIIFYLFILCEMNIYFRKQIQNYHGRFATFARKCRMRFHGVWSSPKISNPVCPTWRGSEKVQSIPEGAGVSPWSIQKVHQGSLLGLAEHWLRSGAGSSRQRQQHASDSRVGRRGASHHRGYGGPDHVFKDSPSPAVVPEADSLSLPGGGFRLSRIRAVLKN